MRPSYNEIKVGDKIRIPIQSEDDQQASLEVFYFLCF
jgi:hypothetical protein